MLLRHCAVLGVFVLFLGSACGSPSSTGEDAPAGGTIGGAAGPVSGGNGGEGGEGAGGDGSTGSTGGAGAMPVSMGGGAGTGGAASNWRGTRRLFGMSSPDLRRLRSGTLVGTMSGTSYFVRFGTDQSLSMRRSGMLKTEASFGPTETYLVDEDTEGNLYYVANIGWEESLRVLVSLRPDLRIRWIVPLQGEGKLVGTGPNGTTWVTGATSISELVVTAVSSSGQVESSFSITVDDSTLCQVGLKPDGTLFVFDAADSEQGTLRTFATSPEPLSNCVRGVETALLWDDAGLLVAGYDAEEYSLRLIDFDCNELWSMNHTGGDEVTMDNTLVARFARDDLRTLAGHERAGGTDLWSVEIGPNPTSQSNGYTPRSLEGNSSVGFALGGANQSPTSAATPFLLRVGGAGQEMFRWEGPDSHLPRATTVLLASPHVDGGTIAIVSDNSSAVLARWDESGRFDPGAPAVDLYCHDADNHICTHITSLGTSTLEAFLAKCDNDLGTFMTTSCSDHAPVRFVCDGTEFDIDGQGVDGSAAFLDESPLSCAQMINSCASANGVPAGGCSETSLAPPREFEFECDGVVHLIELPAATPDCQGTLEFFAQTFACNDVANFASAIADYESCFSVTSN